MFRVATSFGWLLCIGAVQLHDGPKEETQRTPESTKKEHRNLPPNWREQFAADQDQTPPKIDRVTPHPGRWVVDNIGLDQVQIGFTEAVNTPPGSIKVWRLD